MRRAPDSVATQDVALVLQAVTMVVILITATKTSQNFEKMDKKMDKRFEKLELRFEKVDEKIEKVVLELFDMKLRMSVFIAVTAVVFFSSTDIGKMALQALTKIR